MAIFILSERNLIEIDGPIDSYLPHYKNPEKITIYHLLTNSSGIPNFTGFPNYWSEIMRIHHSKEALINLFINHPLHFTPGEQFEYSNSNYTLLASIIENVSGDPYEDFVANNILVPLNMRDTGIDDGSMDLEKLAIGYSIWEKVTKADYIDMSVSFGAYNMYSTLEDLFKWDKALSNGKLISFQSYERLFSPNLQNYGCGWSIEQTAQLGKMICHFGVINGYTNDMIRLVDHDITIIVLSNNSITPVTTISRALAKIAVGQEIPQNAFTQLASKTQNLDSLIGNYACDTLTIELIKSSNTYFAIIPRMYGAPYKLPVYQLETTEENTTICRTKYVNDQLLFKVKTKRVDLIYISDTGKRYLLKKDAI